ncbi:response regulator receiver domain protein (macronuclear) [Tetrahymena thermophila SB210]|uniref:histidine kinase n=1 Tax=Tetrahymena thermophila (strain SB210) TaxID=312017 RepID=Q22D27_TETTS|nr:response regulator receiver domain protein [Tetrahymena thermophila SB210]EAR83226.2 response regulator receiver domain protein [Tetrahymena thermophila SB210]|eukprot:XP_001030889.2 response regulator receiver domain protein [Tetrahymena thermophila SB210]
MLHFLYLILRYLFQGKIFDVRSDIGIIISTFIIFAVILFQDFNEERDREVQYQQNGISPLQQNKQKQEFDILSRQKIRDQFNYIKKESKIDQESKCLNQQQQRENNQFNYKQIEDQNKKQNSSSFDFQELQKTGILIINDKKEVVKINSQFVQFFEEKTNQQIKLESTQVDKRSLREELLLINLKFNNSKLFQSHNNQYHEQLNSLQNNAIFSETNVDKDFFSLIPDQNKQNSADLKQNQNANDSIIKFKEEECQQCIDKNVLMPINVSAHELEDTFIKQNGAQNISNTLQFIHLNNSLTSNSPLYDLENQQNLNATQRTPINYQININNYRINNFQKQNNFQQTSVSSQQFTEGLSKLKQCHIPENIDQLFEDYKGDICLSQVIDFLIKQQPQEIIDSKTNQTNTCKHCQKLINQQNSQAKNKKYPQSQFYKIQIDSNYLIISQIYKDKSNKKKIIDYKIGCFLNTQDASYDLCQKCKTSNPDFSTSVHIANRKMSLIYGDNKTLNQIKEESQTSSKRIESLKQIVNISNSKIDSSQKHYNYKTKPYHVAKICSLMSESDNDHLQRINLNCQTNETSQIKQKDQYNSNEEVQTNIEQTQYLFSIEVTQTDFEIVSENLKNKMDKYRQKLLCSISHELRTPLNCIISMLDMLNMKNDISDANKNYFVNPALFSSYILLNTINDILDMAEVNRSGKIKMLFQEFSPINLCHECLNFIKLQAQQKNLQLIFEYDEFVPKLIYTDLNKTRQVLLNLLSNALKFTQKGNITIKLSYSQENILQIDVSDTGCGIAPEKLKKIFFNFTQPEFDIYSNQSHHNSNQKEYLNSQLSLQFNNNNNNNNSKNAGLGLNISYILAKCLGDNRTLNVQSELGKGSTFTFYIVSQCQNRKGCTYLPVPQLECFNSQRSKYQQDSEYSENNQIQKSFFARNQYQMNQDEIEIQNSQELTTKSISQNNIRGLENNLYIETFKNSNRSQERSKNHHLQSKNGLCLSFNNLRVSPDQDKNNLDSFHSDRNFDHMKELFPESESDNLNSKSKTKSLQTSLVQINFNKTAFQIIQHASNICNQIYSYRDIQEDQHNLNLQVRGSQGNIHSPQTTSKEFFQASKQQSNSKRNSICEDEFHIKILSSNNNLLKNKCSEINIASQKDMKDSDRSINKKLNLSNQHCSISLSSLTQNKNCQLSNKLPLNQIHQEKHNLENFEETQYSNKKVNSELCNQVLKNNYLNYFNSPKQEESCDVMSECTEKKFPNQSEKLKVCEKPQKLQRKKMILKIDQNHQTSKSSDNLCNIQVNKNYQFQGGCLKKDQHVNQNSNQPQNSSSSLNSFIMVESRQNIQENSHEGIKHVHINNQINNFQLLIASQNKQRKCQCPQILIVDDNEFNIYALQIRLKMYSFIIDAATSGFEALDLIKKKKEHSCCNKYSLVFMDIDMPVMNGYQTTEKILQFYKKLKAEPPVISACSAYIQESDKQKAYQVGMKYYITKPINTQSFENVLAQVFQLES